MGSSSHRTITPIVGEIMRINPETVLDVGIGFGKYGLLLREYLEVQQGRFHKKDWQKKIDGIEYFGPFIKDIHSYLYDRIIIDNVIKYPIGDYDLILLCDVLEHMFRADAMKTLDKCLEHSKWVILSTPNGFMSQKELFGNDREEHKSGFAPGEFKGETIFESGEVFVKKIRGRLNG